MDVTCTLEGFFNCYEVIVFPCEGAKDAGRFIEYISLAGIVKKQSDVPMDFEAKSARDGAWYVLRFSICFYNCPCLNLFSYIKYEKVNRCCSHIL